uniref:Squamous cell carcinoma antigen recognized by T-cells 3 n=1 Tax=Timema poppense TaxID=170557 RepID=A0A7R9H203_TIMPO|nr:unnamed protein product [Timema poppensis]
MFGIRCVTPHQTIEIERMLYVVYIVPTFADRGSVQVWLQYVQFAVNHIKTADDVESVRVLFERAVSAAGQHVSKGSLIWTAYRQFECSLLQHLETGGVDCSQQRDICVGLFFRQLSLPLLDTQDTYNLFLEWSSSRLSNIPSLAMDNIKLAVQHTLKELLQILPFEDALTSSLDTSVKVDIFKSYILREKQHGKEAQRVSILYERALVMNPLDQLLWLEYVHFADRHLAPPDTVLGVCSRSTRNCPWFTELWRQKLFLMEKYHQSSHEDMQGVLEQALAVEYTSASDYLLLWLAYADYMRRRIEQDSDQQDQQVTAFTELLAQACEHLAQRFGLKGDPQCILLQYWARIEAAYKGDMEKVRLLWNDIMTQGHSQFTEMWLEYILLER